MTENFGYDKERDAILLRSLDNAEVKIPAVLVDLALNNVIAVGAIEGIIYLILESLKVKKQVDSGSAEVNKETIYKLSIINGITYGAIKAVTLESDNKEEVVNMLNNYKKDDGRELIEKIRKQMEVK